MNLYKSVIIVLFLCFLSGYATARQYSITGKVTGLKDSTRLFLQLSAADKDMDSAMVINNGSFHFTGKIEGITQQAILHTKTYNDYVYFWLENKPISININAGEFKKGTIKGSTTEDENHELLVAEMPVMDKEDSLDLVLSTTKDTALLRTLQDKMTALSLQEMTLNINFVKSHPNSVVSANMLSIYATTWDKKTVAELYSTLSPQMKQTSFGMNVNNFLLLNKNVNIGDKFADFEQPDTKGRMTKLSDIKGKYILLDFWASNCGPCRNENPSLVKSYALYKSKGFTVLGVSLDANKAAWLKAVNDDKLTWENVCDLNGWSNKAALTYGIHGIPDNFLIDSKGNIIARNLRGDELNKKLQELLP